MSNSYWSEFLHSLPIGPILSRNPTILLLLLVRLCDLVLSLIFILMKTTEIQNGHSSQSLDSICKAEEEKNRAKQIKV